MGTSQSLTLSARWVCPASSPPLENGTVTIQGSQLEAIEPGGIRTPDVRLGNVAIIPGLVNAHTHLDLSGARGRIPPTDPEHFTNWLRGIITYRMSRTLEDTQTDIQVGLAECLAAGTTLIGDIAAGGASWKALSEAPVRAVVFRELIGLSEERANQAIQDANEWRQDTPDTAICRKGASPHAPYSARQSLITATAERNHLVAIHLAESPGEIELIRSQAGPFVEFLKSLGAWDASGLIPTMNSPSKWLAGAGHTLFVHCNYDWRSLFAHFSPSFTVVYCPRTHAAFGHPPHPFRDIHAHGGRVCLGTDSLASSPDLDILAEARFVHDCYPDFSGEDLLRMITLSGAEALGWADITGSLTPGKSADLVAIPLPNRESQNPYELLFANDAPDTPRRTMFCGEWRSSVGVDW